MNINKAKRIIEKETKSEILVFEDTSKGWDHKVYIAQTKKGCFVLRVPIKDKNKIKIQAWVCNKWHKIGIPVPKPVVLRRNYLIEECIEGTDFEDIKITKSQKSRVYQKIGQYLKRMHTINTKQYGPFTALGIGKYCSWKEFTDTLAIDCLEKNIRQGKLPLRIAGQIKKKYACLNEYLINFNAPKLVHADLCRDNILIKNNQLSGIIDAADAISGDPLFDIAVIFYDIIDRNIIKSISKTYGEIDFKIVKIYAIIGCLWVLAYHTKKGDVLKERKKLTRLLAQ